MTLSRDEVLLDELAYRASTSDVPTMIYDYAKQHQLERSDLVRIVSHPDFLKRLKDYTQIYLYLPVHKQMMQQRLSMALNGSEKFAEAVYREHLEEGKQASIVMTETHSLRLDSLFQVMKRDGERFGVKMIEEVA